MKNKQNPDCRAIDDIAKPRYSQFRQNFGGQMIQFLRGFAIVILSFLFCANTRAVPTTVILIRHGEKAGSGLSKQGQERAQALVRYFTEKPMLTEAGLPAAIYAFQPQPDGHKARGVETVTPLSDAINVTIDSAYSEDQVESLVAQIMTKPSYNQHTVLICWEHHHIPMIANAFGISSPPDWPSDVYDRTWVIHFDASGNIIDFENLPQRLLPGDSEN